MADKVKRTERGWAGHLIFSDSCKFRRNTLLEYEDRKWIVSTIGCYVPSTARKPETIGYKRWYETMVFEGECVKGYIDTDVTRQISCNQDWGIWGETWEDVLERYPNVDNAANDMHERIVDEMTERIRNVDREDGNGENTNKSGTA